MPNIRSSYTDSVNFFGNTTPQQLAERFGTPLYVYNEAILRQRCRELQGLSSHPAFCVNYSAKANTNLHLLSIIQEEGCVVDAMSPGELHLNQIAGFTPDKILYVCNNVSAAELHAAVDNKVLVSVDSLAQIDLYGQVNPGGEIMVRFNPGIGAGHHQKVITAGKATKFGVTPDDMEAVFALLSKYHLRLAGINQHIGSLFMEAEGYLQAATFLLSLAEQLPNNALKTLKIIDFGGGFGIPYHKYEHQSRLDLAELGSLLHTLISTWAARTGYTGRFFVEPGRFVVAECGLLLGTVHATKNNGDTRYVGTDLGFNVLVRPAMYDSHHDIEVYRENGSPDSRLEKQTIVGNICESGDILAKNRPLPPMQIGDIVGVLDAGAYGYVMASTYNQRLRPAEVCIGLDGEARCIRRRESFDDLLAGYEGM
ncbi:MAG: diaminopimelate decarboxylase [Desulfovibrionaceae bacterium]